LFILSTLKATKLLFLIVQKCYALPVAEYYTSTVPR